MKGDLLKEPENFPGIGMVLGATVVEQWAFTLEKIIETAVRGESTHIAGTGAAITEAIRKGQQGTVGRLFGAKG